MNAKDKMIDDYSQESPWLTLAKRIVRMDLARKAQQKEQDHAQVCDGQQIPKISGA
jgi:hypothetical protein